MTKMLLSIKPEYVKQILEGTKQFEFRKNRCKKDITSIMIYCTAPVLKAVAEADIEYTLEGSKEDIWDKTKDCGGVSREFYIQYFSSRETAVAYKLTNVRKFEEPRDLSYYGIKHAPQSFVYIED